MRHSAGKMLIHVALVILAFANGGAALADRVEYNDFTCEGVMQGEQPRTFTGEVVAIPEPADRYLKLTETVDGAPKMIWEGDIRTSLVIGGRGMYLQYEETGLRFEVFVGAADQATRTFPAYVAAQNQTDARDMIVVEQMTCHVTSDAPGTGDGDG